MAQHNVAVDPSTGMAQISIPVYKVTRGEVSIPISLEYDAKGVRLTSIQGLLGTGWQLNAGGLIVRQVRDLPDDGTKDNSSNSRLGWMHNTNGTKINNFSVQNDNNPSTCTDETTDISYITGNFSDNSDVEPDVFYVQAPGLDCQLVYDNINGVFRTIPYMDVQIAYTYNSTQTAITSFTITNDEGIVYTFAVPEVTTESTSSSAPANILYFKRSYNLFQNGITFNSKWYLSKIQDRSGNYITLTYSTGTAINGGNPMYVVYGGTNNTYSRQLLYTTAAIFNPMLISSITSYNKVNGRSVDQVTFSYASTTDSGKYLLQTIGLHNNAGLRNMQCSYTKVPGKARDYLTSYGDQSICNTGGVNYGTNLFSFAYNSTTFVSGSVSLPDYAPDQSYQDYWGYPNLQNDNVIPGFYIYPDDPNHSNVERFRIYPIPNYTGTVYSLNGASYGVDPSITTGTLGQITYPTGGTTSFTYEPNDYYDVVAGSTFQGGGLRVKQMVDYDGITSSTSVTRNYIYTDPSTLISTGKPISMPALGFTLPYSGTATGLDYWNLSTVRVTPGNSNQDETIIYGKVTVQETGSGKTVYEYSTPATNWDASASPASGGSPDWTPTTVAAGRQSSGGSCPVIGPLKNSVNTYPFIPNTNYGFERGLLTKATTYSEAGNITSVLTNSYTRTYNPTVITGLKFDANSSAEGYSKYKIYTVASENVLSTVSAVNDVNNTTNDATRSISSTTNYYYSSAYHKLPTKIETVNTDGTTDRKYMRYVKDYVLANDDADDATMTAVKGLVSQNVNAPIETYRTVTRAGVENTMTADLIKYAAFPSGLSSPAYIYEPAQTLHFISATGVSNFPPSYNNGGAFASYSGYIPTSNLTNYDRNGNLLIADDGFNNVHSMIMDDEYMVPTAVINNARFDQISYSSFDELGLQYGLTINNSSTTSNVSRSGFYSLALTTSGSLTGPINLKSSSKHYIFSGWVNSSSSGVLTVSLYMSGGTLFSSQAVNFTSSGSGWSYYETPLNTNGLTSTFSVKVQTNTAVNLDDVLFYPDNAEVKIYAYNPLTYLKTIETNTNGVAQYYSYDQYNRLQYVYDQDKNIVLKKTYASVNSTNSGLVSASFTYSPNTNLYYGAVLTFTGSAGGGACTPGTYYSWNFGDGTSVPASLVNTNPQHTFTQGGVFTVTFTASNSVYGTKTTSQSVSVPFQVNVCQSGVYGYTKPSGPALTAPCGGYPNNSTSTYYTVTGLTGYTANSHITYQWQMKYTDGGSGSSWTNVNATSTSPFQLMIPLTTGSAFRPYAIQCIATDTQTGIQGISGSFGVTPGGD